MKLNFRIKWNSELVIAILFLVPSINYYIAALLTISGLPTLTVFIYAALYFLGFFSYFFTIRRLIPFISTLFLCVALFLSAYFHTENTRFMFHADQFFASAVPVLAITYFPIFLLLTGDIRYDKLLDYLRALSVLVLILAIVSFFSSALGLIPKAQQDYMTFAYMMLTPVFICFMKGWKNNRFAFSLSVISAFIIFVVGCRGAAIATAAFILHQLFGIHRTTENRNGRLGLKLLGMGILTLIILNGRDLLYETSSGLDQIGFKSRTIDKLLGDDGGFTERTGRIDIWNEAIDNTDILGKGLFGDRVIIWDRENNVDAYAHNFFLEVLMEFGWFIGAAIVILFCYMLVRVVEISYTSKNNLLQSLTCAMLCVFCIRFMVSASYLTAIDFWFYLGLAVNMLIHRSQIINSVNDVRLRIN